MKKLSVILFLIFTFVFVGFANTPKSKFAKFENNKIHFQTVGKGKQALIFVHGWTCSADFWKESISAFPEYRVIAVDLPGHGRSDKPETNYTMEYFANSIKAVMKKAKVKKAVLVGHSMGTPVIRQFYRLYPKKVSALVIVDGSLRSYGSKEEAEAFIAPLRTNYKENSVKFVDGMLEPIEDKELKQEIRKAMLATPKHVGLGAMEGMLDEKIWEKDKINVPVLAILAKSPWWKPNEKEIFASIIPDLNFQMWEGVSHFLMMEKPTEFNEEIKKFLNEKKLL